MMAAFERAGHTVLPEVVQEALKSRKKLAESVGPLLIDLL